MYNFWTLNHETPSTVYIIIHQVVMRDVARLHAVFLGRTEWLRAQPWLERCSAEKMVRLAPLWRELLKHAHTEFPEMWGRER